jgi:NMD protein affecting ribosome stability and mRNA decay
VIDDQEFDNRHRCSDCGVTGGGVIAGLCDACLMTKEMEAQ